MAVGLFAKLVSLRACRSSTTSHFLLYSVNSEHFSPIALKNVFATLKICD